MKTTPLGPGREFDLIRRFLADAGPDAPGVELGPGDDCALFSADRVAISSDLSLEGVHFRRDWIGPEEIGYRAAAAALSDLAAMAARPIGILSSVAVPAGDLPDYAVSLSVGMREAAAEVGASVLGGDVARSPGPIVLDVTVVGEATRPVLRSGARVGDAVWVTGRLGGAAAAVRAWLDGEEPDPKAREAYARPRPRTREARWLAERGVPSAMLDLSDGLAGDLAHLAAASNVGILLEPERVPVHPAAREGTASEDDALRLALGGGEDYELCFAAPPGAVEEIRTMFEESFAVPLSRVGEVVSGEGVRVRRPDGTIEPVSIEGFRHFGGDAR